MLPSMDRELKTREFGAETGGTERGGERWGL